MKLSTSYIPPHHPMHIETDIKYMKDIGCTDVLFAVQENHFQWLDGAIRFGPKIAEENGLTPLMVLWGYANTSGGGRSSRVMLENPDMWRCDPDGKPISGGWPWPKACYNNPKTIRFFKDYIEIARANGFKGVMVDEPVLQECFCEHCKGKFAQSVGGSLLEKKGSPAYRAFQEQTTIEFARSSCDAVKEVDRSLETQLCMMPAQKDLFSRLCSIASLDTFATDPYWIREINNLTFEAAIDVVQYAKHLADDNRKNFELYLGCFGIPADREEEIYSGRKVLIEKSSPFRATTWSFRGGLGLNRELMEEECDRPDVAWQSIVKLYGELSP